MEVIYNSYEYNLWQNSSPVLLHMVCFSNDVSQKSLRFESQLSLNLRTFLKAQG